MRLSQLSKPRPSKEGLIAVTMGDPTGIGPEIIVKAFNSRHLKQKNNFLIIGDKNLLTKTAKKLKKNGDIPLYTFRREECPHFLPITYIDTALYLINQNIASALVTAPVNKEAITKSGIKFTGHTEYLATKSKVKSPVMMFVGSSLKVALVTRHLPLKNVSSCLTKKKIIETTIASYRFLKKNFKVKNPKIGVLALNPHAGEKGMLGHEERKIIGPAVAELKRKLSNIHGPLPADAGFYDLYHKKFDLLIAMYHDQAMIPIKMLARESAVNVTVGLPYVRTSPVHGTAYDIAGKGIADPSSMIAAMNLATQLIC